MATVKKLIARNLGQITGHAEKLFLDNLERPVNKSFGDFAFPAHRLIQAEKTSPRSLVPEPLRSNANGCAKFLAENFKPDKYVVAAKAVGPFVNFKVSPADYIREVVVEVAQAGSRYGLAVPTDPPRPKQKIIVEFSSPNIAKPFHAGHLRSTIIGNFIKNIHQALGDEVIAINYLGDWGKQYGLLSVGFEKFGSEEKLNQNAIKHLFDVYVAVNEDAEKDASVHDLARRHFARMEEGDDSVLSRWRRFRELSIEAYKKVYARLNVEFDVYSGESIAAKRAADVFTQLRERELLVSSNGAQIVELEESYKIPNALLQKSDGTTLYLTRDIAAAQMRHEEFGPFDKMYYVAGAEQVLHFQQFFKIIELLGLPWAKKCVHVPFGKVRGMSTRLGKAVFLEDIMDIARDCMVEIIKNNPDKMAELDDPIKVAEQIGFSVLVVRDFSARRNKDYDFSWPAPDDAFGDTGAYIQYNHARLAGIVRKSGIVAAQPETVDFSPLVEDEAFELAYQISRLPYAVKACVESVEPCVLIAYMINLCHAISSANNVLRVKDMNQKLAQPRLLLFDAARTALAVTIRLLGLKPLEQM